MARKIRGRKKRRVGRKSELAAPSQKRAGPAPIYDDVALLFTVLVEPSPKVPVSWGELLDKITILEIKLKRIKSETAIAGIRHEFDALLAVAVGIEAKYPNLALLKQELRSVNEALWDIEDAIRGKEASKSFDREFIDLARSVYIRNDQRGRLKREINRLVNSEFVEEKQYTAYD